MICVRCNEDKGRPDFISHLSRVCKDCKVIEADLKLQGLRRCTKCKETKSLDHFYKTANTCRVCAKAYYKHSTRKPLGKTKCPGYVYFVIGSDKVKIGVSKHFPGSHRLKSLQSQSPVLLELIGYIKSDDTRRLESELHIRFAKLNAYGEWFTKSDEITSYIELNAVKVSMSILPVNPTLKSRAA